MHPIERIPMSRSYRRVALLATIAAVAGAALPGAASAADTTRALNFTNETSLNFTNQAYGSGGAGITSWSWGMTQQ
jgi:hypothetical protein